MLSVAHVCSINVAEWQRQPKLVQNGVTSTSRVNFSGYVALVTIYLVERSLLRAV